MPIDTDKPLYYKPTGRRVKITEAVPVRRYHVEFSNGASAWMTQEEAEEKLENAPDRFEFDMRPRNGFRIRSMGDYQFLRVNTALLGRGEIDLDYYDVQAIHRNMGRWLTDRAPDTGVPEAAQHAPRRIRIGCLEFYCHLREFMSGGPLVYVSKVPFGPGTRAPVRIARLYGGAIRTLRDWCNAMLGEG